MSLSPGITFSAHIHDAEAALGCSVLMRLIAKICHPFHDFVAQDFVVRGVYPDFLPPTNGQCIEVTVKKTGKSKTLNIEKDFIPKIKEELCERLADIYQHDRSQEHLLRYYRARFEAEMGV